MKINCKPKVTLEFLSDNTSCVFDYDHYNKLNVLRPKMLLQKLNITAEFIQGLNSIATIIRSGLIKSTDVNELSEESLSLSGTTEVNGHALEILSIVDDIFTKHLFSCYKFTAGV